MDLPLKGLGYGFKREGNSNQNNFRLNGINNSIFLVQYVTLFDLSCRDFPR